MGNPKSCLAYEQRLSMSTSEACRTAFGDALSAGGKLQMSYKSLSLFALLMMVTCTSAQTARQHADRIFLNGKIWTEDDARPEAEALAVSGDKILAVGSTDEIKALASPETVVVNLGGRLVVPGFQDTHMHFPGPSVDEVDLDGVQTLQEFQRRLSDFAKAHPSLPWITGHGWAYSAFPNQTVDKKYIDAVISDRPVYVSERDGHMGLANSKAIQIAGVTRNTPDPPNGHFMREPDGEPTGEFKEAAQGLIHRHIPPESADER